MADTERKARLDALLSRGHLSFSEAEGAVEIAEGLEDSDHRSWYLGQLAQKMAPAKSWDQAVKVARSATGFHDKVTALAAIANEAVKAGEQPVAMILLQEISTAASETEGDEIWPWQKAEALNHAAKLFKQMGDMNAAFRAWDKAFQIAQAGQSHDTDSSSVLVEISKELALAGNLEYAKRVADSIQIAGKRERALKEIGAQE